MKSEEKAMAQLDRLGQGRVGQKCVASLSKLWSGDLTYADLAEAEMALRAILLCDVVFDNSVATVRNAAQFDNRLNGNRIDTELPGNIREIIGSHGFTRRGNVPSHLEIEAHRFVAGKVTELFECIAESGLTKEYQYCMFVVFAIEGFDPLLCARRFSEMSLDAALEFLGDSTIGRDFRHRTGDMSLEDVKHSDLHEIIKKHALDATIDTLTPHLQGLSVFETSFDSRCIMEFYYSYWPGRLLDVVDAELRKRALYLSRHGLHFYVPPLLKIVLHRASARSDIPDAIAALRSEFEKPRQQLWELLREMFEADTLRADEINQELQRAADAIVPSIFKDRIDIVSTGLDVAPGVARAVAGGATGEPVSVATGSAAASARAGREVFSHMKAKIQVRGVSFAHRLSKDLRKTLSADSRLLQKHFAGSELSELGRV